MEDIQQFSDNLTNFTIIVEQIVLESFTSTLVSSLSTEDATLSLPRRTGHCYRREWSCTLIARRLDLIIEIKGTLIERNCHKCSNNNLRAASAKGSGFCTGSTD